MTVVHRETGYFVVGGTGEVLAGPFPFNSAAWRWIDRHDGSPISKAEQTAGWLWDKMVHGE